MKTKLVCETLQFILLEHCWTAIQVLFFREIQDFKIVQFYFVPKKDRFCCLATGTMQCPAQLGSNNKWFSKTQKIQLILLEVFKQFTPVLSGFCNTLSCQQNKMFRHVITRLFCYLRGAHSELSLSFRYFIKTEYLSALV